MFYKILLSILIFANAVDARIVRRAAFDLGSGKLKCQVADLDDEKGTIEKTLFSKFYLIGLQEDLEKSGENFFSDAIILDLQKKVNLLKEEAISFHPEKVVGVATEAYRKAVNGKEVIERINQMSGINAHVISQEEEAALGLKNASLLSKKPINEIIAFDIGGGSFQIIGEIDGEIVIYPGRVGKVPLKKLLLEIQGKTLDQSPNPVSHEEIEKTICAIREKLEDLNPELKNEISRRSVIGVGAMHGHMLELSHKSTYTIEDVKAALNKLAGSTDNELGNTPRAHFYISDLCFLYVVMTEFGIKEIQFEKGTGNTSAILLSEKYWKSSSDNT